MAATECWHCHIHEQQELEYQLWWIEHNIWLTAFNVRQIAEKILWEIEFKEKLKTYSSYSCTIFYPKADYREKWEQELEKELRILRPMKIIHPPVLLSKPTPDKQLFSQIRFYSKINYTTVATLTACLDAPRIRFDKSFTKKR